MKTAKIKSIYPWKKIPKKFKWCAFEQPDDLGDIYVYAYTHRPQIISGGGWLPPGEEWSLVDVPLSQCNIDGIEWFRSLRERPC